MAENKKSFVLYCDQIGLFRQLPDELAGKLIKHIFSYVNDENPETDDLLINIAFEPIKTQLKRDLKEWEKSLETKSESGKLGNLKRWHLDLYTQVIENKISIDEAMIIAQSRKTSHTDEVQSQKVANIAVNVNVNDNVTDNVNVKGNNIEERKLKFADTLKPFLSIYGKEMLNDFFKYWTEPNKSKTKFKMEMEKTWSLERRLETWSKNERNFNKTPKENTQPSQSLAHSREIK